MKKIIIGTFAIIAVSAAFIFAGCEKDEISDNKDTQLTRANSINITTLNSLPEAQEFLHTVSQLFSVFDYNIESNSGFSNQITNYCDNIVNSNNQESTDIYYSSLSQMIFPTDGLDILPDDNLGLIYKPISYLKHLSTSYNQLITAINNTLPEFEDMSEELKIQILARMFEQSRIDKGYIAEGPLEDERDAKLYIALVEYLRTIEMWWNPFHFAMDTKEYCEKVLLIWREYYRKGGTEPKGISCKLCEP